MASIPKQSISNLGIYGVIREAEVDSILSPDGSVSESMNMHFDRKGAATLRPGLTALGSTVSSGNSCLGLFNVQSATAIAAFVASGSLTISSYSGSSWGTSLTGTGAGSAVRFIDFAGRTIFACGTERSMRAWNGSADGTSYWDNTGNPINLQQLWYVNATSNAGYIRPKFIEKYKSKIYLAGDSVNPDRVYFSSVISTSGNVTWATATDFVDINPNDGENITALKNFSLELDIFKPNFIYRFRTTGVDPDPLIKVGTRSQESIVEGKRGLYFHHDTGFYNYAGGYPTEISRPISDFIDAIPYSQFGSIAGWKDNDHIYWFVGNLTIPETPASVTWKNVVLRYTESSQVWTIYSYPAGLPRGTTFINGTTTTRMIGTDSGIVATFNSGTTDIAEPIKYRMVTKWYDFGLLSHRKVIQRLVVACEKAQGAEIMYQTDDDIAWRSLGQLRRYLTYYEPLAVKFHRVKFKLTGVSSVESTILRSIELTDMLDEGILL